MTTTLANIIDKYQSLAPTRILAAVERAASRTGADFAFLMDKAAAESGFDAQAQAKTSSARGLFQFIESTWLTMVKNHGAEFGLKDYADKITVNAKGRACVADCDAKEAILALRDNPEVSALMAGKFTAENRAYLEKNTAGDVGATELYLAHFLGAASAAKFINARAENPSATAAALFPEAAKANKNVFFDKTTGQPRTLEQIYQGFAKKFDETPAPARAAAPAQIAAKPLNAPQILGSFESAPRLLPAFMDEETISGFQKLSPLSLLTLLEMQGLS